MKKTLLLLLISLPLISFSQTKVSGIIKDNYGEPVAFANVIFKDSYEGTISNENGRFYLESDKNYTAVIFSFIGYGTLEIELTKRINYKMKITLEEVSAALDEVVIFSGKQ